jgi:hypothetical protein
VRAAIAAAALGVACSSSSPAPVEPPVLTAPEDAAVAALAPAIDAGVADAAPAPSLIAWRKGSTHVHAAPSGDSSTPPADVIAWYQARGYDFIVLTDHNKVTALGADTTGEPWLQAPADGLLVLAGVELTHNPGRCEPAPPLPDGRCRVHVNALAVTHRPAGRLEWAERESPRRVDMYSRALEATAALGGVAQLNHPQWHWGMTGELLVELTRRGLVLMEIANRQFDVWNAGAADYPSTEALWDHALGAGATLWGVASDDAHSYDQPGRYPAGGGWVMVHAARDPAAIRDALLAGRFYASTGVELAVAGVDGGALVVEVAGSEEHSIVFIGGGRVLAELSGRSARFPLADAPGYVRAVVRRRDGATAWVQPARPAAAPGGS